MKRRDEVCLVSSATEPTQHTRHGYTCHDNELSSVDQEVDTGARLCDLERSESRFGTKIAS